MQIILIRLHNLKNKNIYVKENITLKLAHFHSIWCHECQLSFMRAQRL